MGYACPVCSDPQADSGHLANHLAFTAILGDESHEAWLEAHAPGWGDMGEAELADAIVDDVEETEFTQVFEDTAGGLEDDADPPGERSGALFDDADGDNGHGGGNDHGHGAGRDTHNDHDRAPGRANPGGTDAPMDDEAEAILEEAREMTRRMLEDADGTETDDSDVETASDAADGRSNDDADGDADNNE